MGEGTRFRRFWNKALCSIHDHCSHMTQPPPWQSVVKFAASHLLLAKPLPASHLRRSDSQPGEEGGLNPKQHDDTGVCWRGKHNVYRTTVSTLCFNLTK